MIPRRLGFARTHRAITLTIQEPCRANMDRNSVGTTRGFVLCSHKIDSVLIVTSRVIRSPWSILASACRSNGRCAIEKSNSRKPSFTEFRVREARATNVPPHITTAITTSAYCQRPSGRFDQYFPVPWHVYRFDYSHETGRHSQNCCCEKGKKKEEGERTLSYSKFRAIIDSFFCVSSAYSSSIFLFSLSLLMSEYVYFNCGKCSKINSVTKNCITLYFLIILIILLLGLIITQRFLALSMSLSIVLLSTFCSR